MNYVTKGRTEGQNTGRPPGSPFPDRYSSVLLLKLAGHSNRQLRNELGLTRNQISSVVFKLREKGVLPRSEPKIERPRTQPLHKPNKPPAPVYKPTKGKAITECGDRECRYSIGFDKQGQHLFCAAPTELKSSWCEFHRGRVYKSKDGGE